MNELIVRLCRNLYPALSDGTIVVYGQIYKVDVNKIRSLFCSLILTYPFIEEDSYLGSKNYKLLFKRAENNEFDLITLNNMEDAFKIAFKICPNLFENFPELYNNDEIAEIVLELEPSYVVYCDIKYYEKYKKALVNGFCRLADSAIQLYMSPEKIIKMLTLVPNSYALKNNVAKFISKNSTFMDGYLDNDVLLPLYEQFFKKFFLGFAPLFNDKIINSLSSKHQRIAIDAMTLLRERNKVDTTQNNNLFSYDFVRSIYPIVGTTIASNLLSYNSNAISSIEIVLRKKDGRSFLKRLIKFNRKYNLFVEDSREINYLFKNLDYCSKIIDDVLNLDRELTSEEVNILRGLLMRKDSSRFQYIDSFDNYKELFKFNRIFVKDVMNKGSFFDLISKSFGFEDLDKLIDDLNSYNLFDFTSVNVAIKKIKEVKGNDFVKELLFTKEEVAMIMFIHKVIKCNEDKVSLKAMMKDSQFYYFAKDNLYMYRNIINKVRRLYGEFYNVTLTKVDKINKKKIDTKDGVNIYELGKDDYKLLIHCINNFDNKCTSCYLKLCHDLSLFDRLEGASTVSLSSFSSSRVFMCDDRKKNIGLLFDEVTPDFLLYMANDDLGVSHGKRVFEPTGYLNNFASYDGLVQRSLYNYARWNEIAGYREGMIPSAIFVFNEEKDVMIDDNVVKAAKYFSELKGREVPILVAPKKILSKRLPKIEKIKKNFSNNPNKDTLYNLFYSGTYFNDANRDIVFYVKKEFHELLNFCFEVLDNNLNSGKISLKEYISLVYQIISSSLDIFVYKSDNSSILANSCLQTIKKIRLYVKYLAYINHLFDGNINNIHFLINEKSSMFEFYSDGKKYEVSLEEEFEFSRLSKLVFSKLKRELEIKKIGANECFYSQDGFIEIKRVKEKVK